MTFREITKDMMKQRLADALRRHGPKAIARAIRGSESSVKDWRAEKSEPSAYQLVRLMREFDEVYEVVNQMAGREGARRTLSQAEIDAVQHALSLIGEILPVEPVSEKNKALGKAGERRAVQCAAVQSAAVQSPAVSCSAVPHPAVPRPVVASPAVPRPAVTKSTIQRPSVSRKESCACSLLPSPFLAIAKDFHARAGTEKFC